MKKLYTIVPLALALTALTAHADISVSQEKRTVTISGTLDDKTEGQKITVTVTDEDGEYIYLGQTSSDKDGKYKVVFSPEEDKDADFDIKVKPANTAISEETKSFTYKKAEVKKPSTSKPSSSGGGGGGGGGTVTIPASTPKPQTQPEQTTTPAPAIKPQWLTELGAHWAYNDILALYDKKVIDEEIIPDKIITRLEFVEMICKATGRKAEKYNNIFLDVKECEEALYLQAAVDSGIIAVDTNFRPDDGISRREMCRVLCLAAGIEGLEKTVTFTDEALFGDWSIDHIYNAQAAGLVVGMPDGSFDPLGNVTYAQSAAVTNRIMSK